MPSQDAPEPKPNAEHAPVVEHVSGAHERLNALRKRNRENIRN